MGNTTWVALIMHLWDKHQEAVSHLPVLFTTSLSKRTPSCPFVMNKMCPFFYMLDEMSYLDKVYFMYQVMPFTKQNIPDIFLRGLVIKVFYIWKSPVFVIGDTLRTTRDQWWATLWEDGVKKDEGSHGFYGDEACNLWYDSDLQAPVHLGITSSPTFPSANLICVNQVLIPNSLLASTQ